MVTCKYILFSDLKEAHPEVELVCVFQPIDKKFAFRSDFDYVKSHFPNAQILEIHVSAIVYGEMRISEPLIAAFQDTRSHLRIATFKYDFLEENAYDKGLEIANYLSDEKYSFGLVFSYLNAYNTSLILSALNDQHIELPLCGGLAHEAGNTSEISYLNGEELHNHIHFLLFETPRISLRSTFSQGYEPFGPVFQITRAYEDQILEIENSLAGDFIRDLFKKSTYFEMEDFLSQMCIEIQQEDKFYCSSFLEFNTETMGFSIAGEINTGDTFRFCKGNMIEIMEQARSTLLTFAKNFERDVQTIVAFSDENRLNQFNALTVEESKSVSENTLVFYMNGQIHQNRQQLYQLEKNGILFTKLIRDVQ